MRLSKVDKEIRLEKKPPSFVNRVRIKHFLIFRVILSLSLRIPIEKLMIGTGNYIKRYISVEPLTQDNRRSQNDHLWNTLAISPSQRINCQWHSHCSSPNCRTSQ